MAGELEPTTAISDALVILGAAGIVIPLFARFRITPVIGFLLVGILVGPYGLGALTDEARWLTAVTISEPDSLDIFAEFGRLADENEGLVTAKVRSASPLDAEREERLKRALADRTGRRIRLDVELDPTLIAGAIAQVGDLVIDGSLRTQLGQLRANLMKGS